MKWIYKECQTGGQFAIYSNDEEQTQITYGGCGCCNARDEVIENESDAKLMAAAPELLEALEDIVNDYSERFDMESHSTNPGMKVVVENALAAIALAKGGC